MSQPDPLFRPVPTIPGPLGTAESRRNPGSSERSDRSDLEYDRWVGGEEKGLRVPGTEDRRLSIDPANTAGVQRGRPFSKGTSGNPAGKPKGTRHRATMLAERMMEADVPDVVRAVLAAAKDGDMTAARLILERIVPMRRERTLPAIDLLTPQAGCLNGIACAVFAAAAAGELTPSEVAAYGALLETARKSIEVDELAARIERLENTLKTKEGTR